MEKEFERLGSNDYEGKSLRTPDYNCIAWAAGRDDQPWWPIDLKPYYWPVSPREETLENFISAFELQGYSKCRGPKPKKGIEKVAIYVGPLGNPLHAARQLESGIWTSKIGDEEDIEHKTVFVLEGRLYGKAKVFLKRRRDGKPFLSNRVHAFIKTRSWHKFFR